jgi:hypothetical protein
MVILLIGLVAVYPYYKVPSLFIILKHKVVISLSHYHMFMYFYYDQYYLVDCYTTIIYIDDMKVKIST